MKLKVGKLYITKHSFELGFGDRYVSLSAGDVVMCIREATGLPMSHGDGDEEWGLLLYKDKVYDFTSGCGLDTMPENYLKEGPPTTKP